MNAWLITSAQRTSFVSTPTVLLSVLVQLVLRMQTTMVVAQVNVSARHRSNLNFEGYKTRAKWLSFWMWSPLVQVWFNFSGLTLNRWLAYLFADCCLLNSMLPEKLIKCRNGMAASNLISLALHWITGLRISLLIVTCLTVCSLRSW